MKRYRIITDGSCDMPEALLREKNITVVPFYVTLDGKEYLREGADISKADFYTWMVEHRGAYPKSSTPAAQDFLEAFRAAAQAGEDIVCICITRKFSSSCDVAQAAAELLRDEYPDTRVAVINAMMNTVAQALLVLEAARLRDRGAEFDAAVSALEDIRGSGRIFFTVGSVDYLFRGGRIGKLAGLAGNLIGIRPIITLKEGEIFPSGISRSRTRSLDKVISLAVKYIRDTFPTDGEFSMVAGYGYDREEAARFRDKVVEALAAAGRRVSLDLWHIGAVISVHTGPYPLGLGILRKATV